MYKNAMLLKTNCTSYLNVVCVIFKNKYMDSYFYYTNQNHIKLTSTYEKQITD